MKAVKVQYKVKEDFVETNKKNINAVMEELRSLGDTGVKYSAYNNGNKFVHVVVVRDGSNNVVPELESFKNFQEQLKTALEEKPAVEDLELVDSSFDI